MLFDRGLGPWCGASCGHFAEAGIIDGMSNAELAVKAEAFSSKAYAKLTECGDHELDADCADGEKGYLGAGAYYDKYVMSGKIVKCGY